MNKPSATSSLYFLVIIALLGWFALAAQLYLIIQNRVVSVAETIVRYFSFFTILTNILVVVSVTVLLLKPNNRLYGFFSKPSTITAIAVYITVVGIVYNVILRFLWQPQGLQYVVDELLHTIVPLLFILFWILYVPKDSVTYKQIFSWLIYPLVYVIYTAIHGEITGYYPYPFVDVSKLGYSKVLLNAGGLVIAFSGLSLLLVAVGKYISRKQT